MKNRNALHNDQEFFSQHGEDYLLRKIFPSKNNGFFVEIGCIDGRRFSNTLFFENIGWKGLCVEAHSDYIKPLIKNRPQSIVEYAAVGEIDKENVEFYANSRGSLSTLDKNQEEEFIKYGKYFTGFEVQIVPMLTLDTIFKKHNIKDIDFLSLDIEGYEVQALKGLDLKTYRPRVLVIESESEAHQKELDRILLPMGYHHITSIKQNLFYSPNKSYRKIIEDKDFKNIHLINTEHPLDNTGDIFKTVSIRTTDANPSNKYKSIVKKFFTPIKNIFKYD